MFAISSGSVRLNSIELLFLTSSSVILLGFSSGLDIIKSSTAASPNVSVQAIGISILKKKYDKMLKTNFTLFPTLTTERLTLRQLSLNDEHEIFILRSDSEINKYLDRQMSNTIDDARNFINKVNKNNLLYWAITLSNKNILIGTICLFSFSEEDDKCEIGYELLADFQRQGIMKEAIEKIIDYAFNIVKVKKIEAVPHRANKSSINLLEKLLFKNSNEYDKANSELVYFYLINSSKA